MNRLLLIIFLSVLNTPFQAKSISNEVGEIKPTKEYIYENTLQKDIQRQMISAHIASMKRSKAAIAISEKMINPVKYHAQKPIENTVNNEFLKIMTRILLLAIILRLIMKSWSKKILETIKQSLHINLSLLDKWDTLIGFALIFLGCLGALFNFEAFELFINFILIISGFYLSTSEPVDYDMEIWPTNSINVDSNDSYNKKFIMLLGCSLIVGSIILLLSKL